MSEKQIRVGLIGAGGNTKAFHIPGLAKQGGVQIVAVANRTRESSQRVADQFAIPKVHDHWQALLEDTSIDAVCIGTWPYMHAPLTIAALKAGKHVLCEARIALDHSEARAMLEASLRRPALTAQIVPAPHTLAFDRTIIEMIAGDGTIRLRQPVGGAMALSAGKRGKAELEPVKIDPAKRGGWRVEEEFVNAIRGNERVTHTDVST